eukprot:6182737-Pleurochrysis_carterae.AAC.3
MKEKNDASRCDSRPRWPCSSYKTMKCSLKNKRLRPIRNSQLISLMHFSTSRSSYSSRPSTDCTSQS